MMENKRKKWSWGHFCFCFLFLFLFLFFAFVFCFCFCFSLLGNHWNFFGVYQNGNSYKEKAKITPGKNRGKWLCPLEKFPCYTPVWPYHVIFMTPDFNMITLTTRKTSWSKTVLKLWEHELWYFTKWWKRSSLLPTRLLSTFENPDS